MVPSNSRRGFGRVLAVLALLMAGAGAVALAETPQVVRTRRALDGLADVAIQWQNDFGCNGCHKQPMTLVALGLGKESGYESPRPGVVQALFDGTVSGNGGQDIDGCFGTNLLTTRTVFGARGLAVYDGHFGDARSRFLAAADCLLARQDPDGSLVHDHNENPVSQGTINTTTHGMAVWARALALTGDTSYQQAIDAAEAWLRGRAPSLQNDPDTFTTQDKAMLVAGLAATGAGPDDPDVIGLYNVLAGEQQPDGSWKLRNSYSGGNGHGTGEVVYALLSAGHHRTDPLVDSGTQWLLDHQQPDGLWPLDHWETNPTSGISPNMWGALTLATYPSPLNGLRIDGADGKSVSWATVPGAQSYDLVRGDLRGLAELSDSVDLGVVTCLAADTVSTSVQDSQGPADGEGFFFLMRIRWDAEHDLYGRSTGGRDRAVAAGDCPP